MPFIQTHSIPDILAGASATSGSLASLASTTIAQQPQIMPGQSAQAPTSIIQHGPIRRLPLELLDEIIVTALIDETVSSAFFKRGMYAHRRLALVCALWRAIVVALRRRPWTYSNIHLGKDCATSMVSDDVKASMMHEYLGFSGSEPLNVRLDLSLVSGGIPPYVRAVLEQSHRLQSLSIIGDLRDEGAHSALSLIAHPGDLPILRNLSLEDLLDFLCFPAIEEVTIKRDEKSETEVMVALQSDIHDGGGDVERLVVNYV
ncbi:uncharacterized protein SCHCODRAFT_02667314 [Schizophyllum commune H4-8]|uniref:uncharacterized protein n=1 Tax=Schizophyllum commune (strain H4-8 / FGSC 9210) TaxID=578458 RepID=UPI00215E10CE|nr:uncharacterized protein SCHCODRAFT_02667314 [Schizophyllum commune H4-8]KAI5894282.1 hypothetical protein SCHCODRAFT_02667314 [Schizophyllum commune H4-8]